MPAFVPATESLNDRGIKERVRRVPVGALTSINQIYTMAESADCLAASLILREVYADVPIVEVGSGPAGLIGLDPKPAALFVGISPPGHVAEEWFRAGAVVLDHHSTATEIVSLFGPRGFGEDEESKSAARLAYDKVWLAHRLNLYRDVPLVTRLEGYQRVSELAKNADIFERGLVCEGWDAASCQAHTLLSWPLSDWLQMPSIVSAEGEKVWAERFIVGRALRAAELRRTKAAFRGSDVFCTKLGTLVRVMNGGVIEEALQFFREDLLINFQYRMTERGMGLGLDCLASSRFEVARFCTELGGVAYGQRGRVPMVPGTDRFPPFRLIEALVRSFEGEALP